MNLLFHTEINFLINNNVTCPAIIQGKLFILILKLISVYVSCLLLPAAYGITYTYYTTLP